MDLSDIPKQYLILNKSVVFAYTSALNLYVMYSEYVCITNNINVDSQGRQSTFNTHCSIVKNVHETVWNETLCSFTYDYSTNDVFIIIIINSPKTATIGQDLPLSLRLTITICMPCICNDGAYRIYKPLIKIYVLLVALRGIIFHRSSLKYPIDENNLVIIN